MKRRFLLVLCVLALLVACEEVEEAASENQQVGTGLLKLGDDLVKRVKQEKPSVLLEENQVSSIPEELMQMYASKSEELEDEDVVFIKFNGMNVGVFEYLEGEPTYLLDLKGDGILDTVLPGSFMPVWVMNKSASVKKDSRNNVRAYFDGLMEIFNGEAHPYNSGLLGDYIDYLKSELSKSSIANRDAFYGLYLHYGFSDAGLKLQTLEATEAIYKERFSDSVIPSMLYLLKLEAYINLGEKAKAFEMTEKGISLYPNCIPILVYSWQLESNAVTKQKKYNELKTKHPTHWIVKQI